MKCVVVMMCCLVCGVSVLFGNGGGYFRGGVEKAGDLAGFEPKETDKIRMLDEKLTIKLGPKEADVEVRYVMRNEADKKIKVRFGFPVEESFDGNPYGNPDDSVVSDGKKLKYCRNYRITAAGKTLDAKWEKERITGEIQPQFKGVAGWLISEVAFAANEEKPVMIRFQSGYSEMEMSVSESSSRSAAVFRYRLSSAACWAGTIGMGKIVIEPVGVHPDFVRVLKPVNRFKRDGRRWVWDFEGLEPALADDIEIEAIPGEFVEGGRKRNGDYQDQDAPPHQLVDYVERHDKWSMRHSNYQVKASSTMKADGGISYVPENLRVAWDKTAWSEGVPGPGTGEWLEITPVEAKPLIGLEIKPGYQKEGLFKANARPKKLQIELNGEHRFDAEIPDKEGVLEIPVVGYAKPVRKIRMTFTEVYAGEKFEDLCVTSIRLHVRLDKKPKIAPTR